LNNKEFWKRLVAYNELYDLLADAQSGSQRKRRAAEVVLQKVQTWGLRQYLLVYDRLQVEVGNMGVSIWLSKE
jgi:hypothetical protein